MAWSLRGHTRRACRILVRIVYYSTGSVAPLNIWNESGVGATFYVTVIGVGIFSGRNVEYCTTMNNVHKHTKLIFHTILQKIYSCGPISGSTAYRKHVLYLTNIKLLILLWGGRLRHNS